jgi:hypothetical protein
VASSPYPELSDDDWGRLLAIGVVHRQCAPTLRQFATRRAGSIVLRKLHEGMAMDAAIAATQSTDVQVAGYMCAATAAKVTELLVHPDCEVDDRPVLEGVSKQLAENASCGDPFDDLYTRCEAACAQLYGRAWLSPAPFEVRAISAHPRSLSDAYVIDGSTTRPVDGRGVRLKLCPTEFGPEVFAVLARVLLHELICHVGAGDGEDADPLSPFAEGLMDWTSLHYLEAWAPQLCVGYPNAAIMHARQSAESFKADFGTKAARESGQDAALTLVAQHGRPTSVAHLALDLNAAVRPREPKDELVRRVLAGTLDASRGPLREVLGGRMSVEQLLDSL